MNYVNNGITQPSSYDYTPVLDADTTATANAFETARGEVSKTADTKPTDAKPTPPGAESKPSGEGDATGKVPFTMGKATTGGGVEAALLTFADGTGLLVGPKGQTAVVKAGEDAAALATYDVSGESTDLDKGRLAEVKAKGVQVAELPAGGKTAPTPAPTPAPAPPTAAPTPPGTGDAAGGAIAWGAGITGANAENKAWVGDPATGKQALVERGPDGIKVTGADGKAVTLAADATRAQVLAAINGGAIAAFPLGGAAPPQSGASAPADGKPAPRAGAGPSQEELAKAYASGQKTTINGQEVSVVKLPDGRAVGVVKDGDTYKAGLLPPGAGQGTGAPAQGTTPDTGGATKPADPSRPQSATEPAGASLTPQQKAEQARYKSAFDSGQQEMISYTDKNTNEKIEVPVVRVGSGEVMDVGIAKISDGKNEMYVKIDLAKPAEAPKGSE